MNRYNNIIHLLLNLSYLTTAPVSTCAPFAQSCWEQNSAGLCEIPSLHGTKIIAVGALRLVNIYPKYQLRSQTMSSKGNFESERRAKALTLSCPAPEIILCVKLPTSCSPSSSFALSATHSTHVPSNLVAPLSESSVHCTSHFLPKTPPSFKSPTLALLAISAKSCFNSFSNSARTLSDPERMSRLNRTFPGTVLVLPGSRFRMPVLARHLYLAARRWECKISLADVRRASARLAKSVVPVWQSRPVTSIVCQR